MKKITKLFLIITFFSIGTTHTAGTRLRVLKEKIRLLFASQELAIFQKLAILKEFNVGSKEEFRLLERYFPKLVDPMIKIGLEQALRRNNHASSDLQEPLTIIYDAIGYPQENQRMTFADIYIFYVTTFKVMLTEESFNALIQPIVDDPRLSVFEKILALKKITTIGAVKTGVGFATLFLVGLAITNQF